jgi:hypothetical protein
VEVFVSIAIVTILAGIFLLIAGPGMAKAKTEPRCGSNLHQIAAAYALYETENDGIFPDHSLLFLQPAGSPLQNVSHCPLNRREGYWDDVQWAKMYALMPVLDKTFPDGKPIPVFDPDKDILYRCLDHAYFGFSRDRHGGMTGILIDEGTHGKVLGVRLNGSVSKVSPLSCYYYRHVVPRSLNVNTELWQNCD